MADLRSRWNNKDILLWNKIDLSTVGNYQIQLVSECRTNVYGSLFVNLGCQLKLPDVNGDQLLIKSLGNIGHLLTDRFLYRSVVNSVYE